MIDLMKSAHEILIGPYGWNRYPLAPLGCKAIVYEDGDTCGSWALRGVDAWYLGPSKGTTAVIFIISLKPKLIVYLGRQNCSRNTANFPT